MGVLRGLTGAAKKALGKRGRLKAGEKAALTKAAKQNDMSVTEFRKAAKKDLASEAGEGTASDKAVAKRLKISVAELKKKRKAAKKKKKTPKKWQRSKKERAELARLKSQQRKAMAEERSKGAGIHGGRREETVRAVPGRTGLQRPHIIESPSGRLKSKQITDTDDWTKTEKFRQRRQPHADPQSQIAEAMGLRGKGSLPTSEEAAALGLTIKKGGGIVVDAKFGKLIKSLMKKTKKATQSVKDKVDAERTQASFKREYKKIYGKPWKKGASTSKMDWVYSPTAKKKTPTLKQKLSTKSRPKPKAKRISPLTKPKPGASPAKIKQWRIAKSKEKTPTQRAADRKKFEEKAGITLSKKSFKMPKKKADEARKALGLKKKPVVAKKPVKKPTGIRRKLQGKSATDIHKAYTIPEINKMKKNLGQAGTPDKKLISRLNKALAARKKVKGKPEEFDWKKAGYSKDEARDALGLTRKDPSGVAVHHKRGGVVKRNKGGAVRGVGKATKGFGNAKYSKKLY